MSGSIGDYGRAVAKSAAASDDEQDRQVAELRALVQLGLGYALDDATFARLVEIQASLRTEQQRLIGLCLEKQITREKYLHLLNQVAVSSAKEGRDLLGRNQYEAIFGEEDGVRAVINPETFVG